MEVFRITLRKHSSSLYASGHSARWNSAGKFVIYTAGSRALACLENLVHRSGEGLNENFSAMVIEIPDDVSIQELTLRKLPKNWHEPSHYPACQKIGDLWLKQRKYCVLRVPSAIVSKEFNYLIHPGHPDFSRIRLKKTEKFSFDPRLME